jgi:hypothetical protein
MPALRVAHSCALHASVRHTTVDVTDARNDSGLEMILSLNRRELLSQRPLVPRRGGPVVTKGVAAASD